MLGRSSIGAGVNPIGYSPLKAERTHLQERYFLDVLTQAAAVKEGLRGVGKLIMLDHLDTSVADSLYSDADVA